MARRRQCKHRTHIIDPTEFIQVDVQKVRSQVLQLHHNKSPQPTLLNSLLNSAPLSQLSPSICFIARLTLHVRGRSYFWRSSPSLS